MKTVINNEEMKILLDVSTRSILRNYSEGVDKWFSTSGKGGTMQGILRWIVRSWLKEEENYFCWNVVSGNFYKNSRNAYKISALIVKSYGIYAIGTPTETGNFLLAFTQCEFLRVFLAFKFPNLKHFKSGLTYFVFNWSFIILFVQYNVIYDINCLVFVVLLSKYSLKILLTWANQPHRQPDKAPLALLYTYYQFASPFFIHYLFQISATVGRIKHLTVNECLRNKDIIRDIYDNYDCQEIDDVNSVIYFVKMHAWWVHW